MTLHTGIGDLGEGRILLEVVLGNCLLGMEEANVSDVDHAALGKIVTSIGLGALKIVGLAVLVQHVTCLKRIEAEVGNVATVVNAGINERLSIEDGNMPLAVGDNGLTKHGAVVGGAAAGGSDVHLDIGTGSVGTVADRNVAGTVYACEGIPVRIGTDRDDMNVAVLKGQAILGHVAGIAAGNGLDVFGIKHVHGLHGIGGLGLGSLGSLSVRSGGIGLLGFGSGSGRLVGLVSVGRGSLGIGVGGLCGVLFTCCGLFGGLVGHGGVIYRRLGVVLARHEHEGHNHEKGQKN